MRIGLLAFCLLLSACRPATSPPSTPRTYVAPYTGTPPHIDGRLSDPAWAAIPFTHPFVDIEGPGKPGPRFPTQVKMMWDDAFFYVGARLQEPHVWGTLTERNAIIYHDNDFEIFLDPDGDNHRYYEFEVNALNTIWELTLEKPYRDGGPARLGTNLPGLRSAVHVAGTLNDPSDTDTLWSVEVALPWSALARYSPAPLPPEAGTRWRVNFSRVQWQHTVEDDRYVKVPDTREDNWVWSPQGAIDMHRPERWGFVQFSRSAPGNDAFLPDPSLPARAGLMDLYYAQRRYRKTHGRWAQTLSDLALSSPDTQVLNLHASDSTYTASAVYPTGDMTQRVWLDHTGRLWVAE